MLEHLCFCIFVIIFKQPYLFTYKHLIFFSWITYYIAQQSCGKITVRLKEGRWPGKSPLITFRIVASESQVAFWAKWAAFAMEKYVTPLWGFCTSCLLKYFQKTRFYTFSSINMWYLHI